MKRKRPGKICRRAAVSPVRGNGWWPAPLKLNEIRQQLTANILGGMALA
jgi:hypothetical protein